MISGYETLGSTPRGSPAIIGQSVSEAIANKESVHLGYPAGLANLLVKAEVAVVKEVVVADHKGFGNVVEAELDKVKNGGGWRQPKGSKRPPGKLIVP